MRLPSIVLLAAVAAARLARAGAEEEHDDDAPVDAGLVETIEVEGRLGADPAPRPARVDERAVSREDVSGARSVAELLARLPSISAADETGNGRQLSLELRGFGGSAGATAVTLDGLRLNEADTNLAAWELVRLEDLERVEVLCGPRAALGGGSLAGVVHVRRRRPPAQALIDASLTFGSHDLLDVRAFGGAPVGRVRLAASGSMVRDDGFRDGASVREAAGRIALSTQARGVEIGADWSHVDGTWSQPGALTKDEIEDDPSQSRWNELDVQDSGTDLVTVRAGRAGARRTSWEAVAGHRRRAAEILTTGRSGYGFITDDDASSLSGAGEARTRLDGSGRVHLRWGAEVARDHVAPRGWFTGAVSTGSPERLDLASDVEVDWSRLGAFTLLETRLGRAWSLEAGLRHDRSRVDREGVEAGSTGSLVDASGRARFEGTVGELDVAREVVLGRRGARGSVHARWAQSFLAPSAIQLFAYPGYASNPDLSPQRGAGVSIGFDAEGATWSAGIDAFRTWLDDEIAYDGAERRNVNAGRTRREGVEIRIVVQPHPRVRLDLDALVQDATFRGGWGGAAASGAPIPLVPSHDVALTVELGPWRGGSARLSFTHLGGSPLSNDFDATSPRLPDRRLLDLCIRKEFRQAPGLSLAVSASNLLDDRHPSRGIEGFDSVSYFTPAPPRAVALSFGIRRMKGLE